VQHAGQFDLETVGTLHYTGKGTLRIRRPPLRSQRTSATQFERPILPSSHRSHSRPPAGFTLQDCPESAGWTIASTSATSTLVTTRSRGACGRPLAVTASSELTTQNPTMPLFCLLETPVVSRWVQSRFVLNAASP
jgi:hypothetical protein